MLVIWMFNHLLLLQDLGHNMTIFMNVTTFAVVW